MKRALILAPLLAFATPAHADTLSAANHWEAAYVALNIIDTIQTMDCIHRDLCEEANPIMGKHPSDAKLIIGKVLLVGIQFAIFERAKAHNPKSALRVAQIGVGMTGATVALNARFTF
jgi:hypothetical protein